MSMDVWRTFEGVHLIETDHSVPGEVRVITTMPLEGPREPTTDTQGGGLAPCYSEGSKGGPNLECALQEFATALESERSGLWEAAWVIHRVVGPSSSMLSRKERKVMFGAFASVGNCTAAWVAQLHALAESFPEPASTYQDKSISWHRKVAQRAKALKRSVTELAQEAIDKGWGQFELDQLGKKPTVRSTLTAECAECHAKVRVRTKDLKGLMVPCPVCVGIKYEGVPDRPYDGFLGRLG